MQGSKTGKSELLNKGKNPDKYSKTSEVSYTRELTKEILVEHLQKTDKAISHMKGGTHSLNILRGGKQLDTAETPGKEHNHMKAEET